MIKFLDIYNQDKKIINLINSDLKKIIQKNNFILGDEVRDFENNFAKYCHAKYAIGCANGTDALLIALKSLNLPKNSEIINSCNDLLFNCICCFKCRLKPVLVDIDKILQL